MKVFFFCILCFVCSFGFAGAKHKRDGSNLLSSEREFAEKLSITKRKIFCGKFNQVQRQEALQYVQEGKAKTPDQAVIKVMEDSGMSLAIKKKAQISR